jgi:branched-chain amino acid aminotransferase
MAKGFSLSIYPWVYIAKFQKETETWSETYQEKPHKSPEQEAALSEDERNELLARRNSFPDLPLVNYTSQYGMGCFEGLKAFPHKDGSTYLFRPDQNAKRMVRSMAGLHMPVFPEEKFTEAVKSVVAKNKAMGFMPAYDPVWEADDFAAGWSVYIRPFSYSEPAIGLGLSEAPWVVIVTTPVGSYFRPGNNKAVTTNKVRAFPGGTGWIKCASNYVIPTLAKKEAEGLGYMEAVFLDAKEKTYLEEGSSCNIFVLLEDDTLVTPDLGDTILPGINRDSAIALARDLGITVAERRISIDEAMEAGKEMFVTGTAAGVAYIESVTHRGQTKVYNDGKIGEVTKNLLHTLKGIQYGAIADTHGWLVPVD